MSKNKGTAINGWLILDKPLDITSAHAVAKVKRLLSSLPSPLEGEGWMGGKLQNIQLADSTPHLDPPPQGGRKKPMIKIGHAGTLDPLASGILPLALGEATKTVPYMMDAAKSYAFTVTWGQERATDDAQGEVVAESASRPTNSQIIDILKNFTGPIQQMPPNYSAIKVGGQRAYDAAREGAPLELKVREVVVHSLSVIASEAKQSSFPASAGSPRPEGLAMTNTMEMTDFICHCGKGTYIRSLARDMGRVLGCYGYVSRLRRLSVGKFDESCAISLEKLEEMVHKGELGFLQPVEAALDDILARDIDSHHATLLRQGMTICLPDETLEERGSTIVLARHDGKAFAICGWSRGMMKPLRVFNL